MTSNIFLFYSKYSQASTLLLKKLNKNKVNSINIICIDNVTVRKKTSQKISVVPCLLLIENNVSYLYTDHKLYEWLNNSIPGIFTGSSIPDKKQNEPQPPPVLEEPGFPSMPTVSTIGNHIPKGHGHNEMASSSLANSPEMDVPSPRSSEMDRSSNSPRSSPERSESSIEIEIPDEKYPVKTTFKDKDGFINFDPVEMAGDPMPKTSRALTKKKKDLKEEASKMEDERLKEEESLKKKD